MAVFIAGWLAGQVLEAWSWFTLGWEIEVADVLSIIVDILLAIIVAKIIEKSIQDTRIEKDFFIKELDNVMEVYTELDRLCSKETTLSYQTVVYDISRSRKLLARVWKSLANRRKSFCTKHQQEYNAILSSIRGLDQKLTDMNYYEGKPEGEKIKIVRNHIYLNNSVKPGIDKSVTDIKEKLLQMKIAINKM